MKNSRLGFVTTAVLCALALASPALARPEICEAAAARAAQDSRVPLDVLLAIALTETGRAQNGQMRPWPWAANTEGRGHWFADRDAALDFLRQTLARGQRSIDLGCFQINLRWHGTHFPNPEAMLDPLEGARYAARYLSDLYDEFGSWEGAAGAYHSRTPGLAERYRTRFSALRANLRNARGAPAQTPAAVARAASTFPLLTGTANGASLVPASLPGARPLFAVRP